MLVWDHICIRLQDRKERDSLAEDIRSCDFYSLLRDEGLQQCLLVITGAIDNG
jgi:hypothetical protein